MKCKVNFYPIFDINTVQSGLAHNYHEDSDLSGMNNRYPFIHECIDNTTVEANLLSITTSVNNCSRFIKSTINSLYGCFSCIFGYTGEVKLEDETYFIEECISMTDCNLSQRYPGLGSKNSDL